MATTQHERTGIAIFPALIWNASFMAMGNSCDCDPLHCVHMYACIQSKMCGRIYSIFIHTYTHVHRLVPVVHVRLHTTRRTGGWDEVPSDMTVWCVVAVYTQRFLHENCDRCLVSAWYWW